MSEHSCNYVNCENRASYIVIFNGRQYLLCKTHFKRVVTGLTKIAVLYGHSKLEDLKIKKERGRIRLISSRKISKEKFLKQLERLKKFEGVKRHYIASFSTLSKRRISTQKQA